MFYLVHCPSLGHRPENADEIEAHSATAAIKRWCVGRFMADPEFAKNIDWREVVVSDTVRRDGGYGGDKFVVNVRIPPPEFDVLESKQGEATKSR